MAENKKIKNASPLSYDGIEFKSKLEVTCYKTLKEAGFSPSYEGKTFVIWQGFKPTVPFYNRSKKDRQLALDSAKLRDVTYTPDFIFHVGKTTVIIEAKGFEDARFPIKKKLFRGILECLDDVIYFEIRTKKELLKAISIINEYTKGTA